MEKYRIGFLDSGVGGISVLASAKMYIPDADYIYYADTDHVPYGLKTHAEIIEYTDAAVGCLVGRGADAVVIACNTATSVAVRTMRGKYSVPIIGMEPALKPAAERHPNGKILVTATKATIEGEKLRSLIASTGTSPDLAALSRLVDFAENGVFDSETVVRYLAEAVPNGQEYSAVVLGCTHFTYFREAFSSAFPNAEIIDGNMGAVRRLASVLSLPLGTGASHRGTTQYIRSGRDVTDENELAAFESYERRMTDYYKQWENLRNG